MISDILVVLVIVISGAYYLLVRRPKYFPQGPTGWPIVGCFFTFKLPRYLQYIEWGKKYGNIFGLYLGSTPLVVLNNYKDIKEAFAEIAFNGRKQSEPIKARNLGGTRGILFSEGKVWSEQRRFSLKNLRDFGFGKKSMETVILEEVKDLIDGLKKQVGTPLVTQNRFNVAVLNVLWFVTAGERINHDDPRLNSLLSSLTSVLQKRPIISFLAEHIPMVFYARKYFSFLFDTSSKKMQKSMLDYVNETIQNHKNTFQEDSPLDFIDVYLTEIRKTSNIHSTFHDFEGEQNLRVVLMDFFLAGAETTSNTLTWALLILALHPHKQEKLYEEIFKVVGHSRHVSLTDRAQLPYLEATIFEIQRFVSLVPLITHNLMEDIKFKGFHLKKGVSITANLFAASRDKEAWGDPDNFRPERFLSIDGQSLVRHEAWLPFGTGKRACLGETLARDELFLFAGNLFQQFQVTTVKGEPKPTLEPYDGGVLMTKPHRLILLDRCNI